MSIVSFLERLFGDKPAQINAAAKPTDNGALSYLTEKTATTIQAKTLKDWQMAIAAATNPDSPEWALLYNLHENLLIDDHLASVIDSRILHAKRTPIKFVDAKGEENKEVSKLFERPWFEDLIDIAIGSRFRGRRLIELYELNDLNELETVTEIKQPWFNANKGIITKNPGDTTGWNYREGIYADHYVQVGKNDNLGMLTPMAPIVLAKKLGMGSWLDFVDKYGVPPLFITTDREDKERMNQLWAAASKFKSNNFMVGRGQEKFEFADINGANVDPFERLALRADNMISKRVLGGTGLTDEKGFVGSVEIQYKLAKDRFESDKLFFKYFFNAQIRPRLIKLSPVYAPLKTFSFEWDNAENMGLTELVNLIVKLGELYEIEPEYLKNTTGIPIVGRLNATAPIAKGENPAKK